VDSAPGPVDVLMCQGTGFSNAVSVRSTGSGLRTPALSESRVLLRPVDSVEITIIVDNTIDLLLTGDQRVARQSFVSGWTKRPQLMAEHGYSVLFTFRKKGTSRSFLYDAGLTQEALLHNLDALGVRLHELEAIVLSHGHTDHHGGLLGLVKRLGKRVPLVLHPDAWRNRKMVLPSGAEFELPPPNRRKLEESDVQILEERGPSMLISDEALVSGQVERVTSFEKGVPQYAEEDGKWVPDSMVWDDQGIICHVNGKGLVVVSSCSHAGVINVLRNAQRITGVDRVYGFVGGLHLPGAFEKIIPETVRELESIRPGTIVPGHCSGWKAIHEIARRMPDAFIPSSVGTIIRF
jgi:7,8-dihydropterin-6-yl-methyl-4-(beta-D-ribofuranosyl)aminobenzene 5'-phosphate synthase